MAEENQETPDTAKMVETPLEKAHTASDQYKAYTASEGHFGHLGQSHPGGLTDAHQAQPGAATAQALAQAMGGFPSGGSAISDPNVAPQIQATASNNPPNDSEPGKG